MNNRTQKLSDAVSRLLIDQEAGTTTEYGVILGVIVLVVVASVALFGYHFSSTTESVYSGLSNGTDAPGGAVGPGGFRSQVSVSVP